MKISSSIRGNSTSISLIGKLKRGDDSGWEQMVALYAPLVRHWCRRSNLDQEATADVTQDVFRTVAQSIGSFRRDREGGTFRGWLKTIFRSRVVDHVRLAKHQPCSRGGSDALRWLENAPDTDDMETDPASQELFRRVLDLVQGEFSESAWRAFWMTVVDGRTSNEVAAELDMTPGAVRQTKYRILRCVREQIGDVD